MALLNLSQDVQVMGNQFTARHWHTGCMGKINNPCIVLNDFVYSSSL